MKKIFENNKVAIKTSKNKIKTLHLKELGQPQTFLQEENISDVIGDQSQTN